MEKAIMFNVINNECYFFPSRSKCIAVPVKIQYGFPIYLEKLINSFERRKRTPQNNAKGWQSRGLFPTRYSLLGEKNRVGSEFI